MGIIHIELPDELQALVDRQISEGRSPDTQSFMTEAAQRFADELALTGEWIAIAKEGIADIEAGRFRTIASAEDAEAWHEERMTKLLENLGTRKG